MNKPLLLLDVDGVLNPYPGSPDGSSNTSSSPAMPSRFVWRLCTATGAMPAPPIRPEDKVAPVDASVGERPAAWLDDLVSAAAREWAAGRTAATLLIEVDPSVGLTRHHVDGLTAWAGVSNSRQLQTGR
jgi:hypothetical protein